MAHSAKPKCGDEPGMLVVPPREGIQPL
jgi:hypothetical protein